MNEVYQREILAETIRKQMCRGNYQMDIGELPYSGPAMNVADALWTQGWRAVRSEWESYEELVVEATRLWATLTGIQMRMKENQLWEGAQFMEAEITGAMSRIRYFEDKRDACIDEVYPHGAGA